DWLSFCNEDMSNYCLGAGRVLRHGYFDLPRPEEVLGGRDLTQWYWFSAVLGGVRPGADLMLAWTSALTGLSVHQVFMPLTLAFHLCLISATGALAGAFPGSRRVASWTCGLMGVSAVSTFGVVAQLIAQVLGLALLCAAAAVLFRSVPRGRPQLLGRALLGGIVIGALLVAYPEVTPF